MAGKTVKYSIRQILEWADRHHEWFGEWPISRSGPIHGTDHTWEGVNTALRKGICGLPGGDSLARLLRRKRGVVQTRRVRPDITLKQILDWAELYHQKHGEWPGRDSGPVDHAPDVSWSTIHSYLLKGGPNLKPMGGLPGLLRDRYGVWDRRGNRMLTEELVLKWAKVHFNHFGRWPTTTSGPLINQPNENWAAIDVAMRNNRRGFGKRLSLSQLLRREVGDDRYLRGIGVRKKPQRGLRVRAIRVTSVSGA